MCKAHRRINSGNRFEYNRIRECKYLCLDLKEFTMDMLDADRSQFPREAMGVFMSVKLMDQRCRRKNIAEYSQNEPGSIFVYLRHVLQRYL